MTAASQERVTKYVELVLEVDPEAEPIGGRLRAPDGMVYGFAGWLGLTAALEGIRKRHSRQPARVSSGPDALTKTEKDVAALVCEGLTNPQIAQRLGVSPRTIQGHLLKIFRKLGVPSRTALVAHLLRPTVHGSPDAVHDPHARNAPSVSQEPHPPTETIKP